MTDLPCGSAASIYLRLLQPLYRLFAGSEVCRHIDITGESYSERSIEGVQLDTQYRVGTVCFQLIQIF